MKFRLVTALFAVCLSAAGASLGPNDFLCADGTVLRADRGHGPIVVLCGTNLGGWMMQEAWMSPNGEGLVSRARWTASGGGTDPAAVVDGDQGTAWTAPAGASLTVDLGSMQTFSRVVLRTSDGFPPTVRIECSDDRRTWRDLPQRGDRVQKGLRIVDLRDGVTTRALRLTPTTPAGATARIGELDLLQDDDYTVRMTLERRFGRARADALVKLHQRTWIRESDLDQIRDIGLNLVRVPMNWLDFVRPDGAWRDDAFVTLDWLVAACASRGIYVLLDMHAVPGGADPWDSSGHAGDDGTGRNPHGIWESPGDQRLLAEIWRRIAEHFRGNPAVAGYDLMNEPILRFDEVPAGGSGPAEAVLVKTRYYDRLYREVRAVDPGHLVVVEAFTVPGPGGDPDGRLKSGFAGILPPEASGWTNVMVQTHHYDMGHPDSRDAQLALVRRSLADIARHQREWNVPVYAGEYCLYDFPDVWTQWMRGLTALGVSWSNWAYKVRGPDGGPKGGNWGFFYSDDSPVPEPWRDSPEQIAAALGRFSTEHFRKNDVLIETVGRCAREADSRPARLQAGLAH